LYHGAVGARILGRVGLDAALAERYPHELSGGQAQRVAIARALLPNPQVLICDEALAALDGTVRRGILELLASLQKESSLSLVLITHDLGVVREIADRVVVMQHGKIVETASNRELFANPREPYTQRLLAAIPTLKEHSWRAAD
jgi:peptide/nickel transport system ATP-binding protein